MSKPHVQTHLILPDMHFPEHHEPTFKAILDFMSRVQVDGVTWLGDQLDLSEISHWNAKKPGLKKRGELRENLDAFNSGVLDPIDALLGPKAVKRWHVGNHERVIEDMYEASPELDGMLDLDTHLKLQERGYEIIELGGISELGHLSLIHGDGVGSGKYIANKLVDSHCTNIVMGHVHAASSFTKVAASNSTRKWMGWTMPTMGTTNPDFARNRPNAHTNGFGIVELYGNQFNLYTIITDSITGQFSYGGSTYSGKRKGK